MVMPELKCNVHTCAHNKNYLCDLDAIEVAGSTAQVSRDTSCASFVEKKATEYTNSTREGTPLSDVKCQAVECQYNKSYECHAGKISVGGNDACTSDETECASFEKER